MEISELRSHLKVGQAIPALPLSLDENRRWSIPHQRALVRYYFEAGAGGLAVAVHSTQFEIREAKHALLRPVLELAAEEAGRLQKNAKRPFVLIAGLCGKTTQAVEEARHATDLGYDAGLLSLAAMRGASTAAIVAHCREVAQQIPLVGFYLQPAVGGLVLPYDFWRAFMEIPNVVGVKMAPFNRYQTIDVIRALAATGREDIDDQHRKIIDFLKILGATSSAEYESKAVDDVLDGLSDYVKMHFKHEESLMDSFDYDERDRHKRIHAGFVEKLDGINRGELHNSGGSEKLFFLIYNWLVTHIVSIDRIMIAKMNGEYDDGIGSETVHKQTGIVIENAYELAARIMNVNLQTSSTSDDRHKKSIIHDVSKSTERLINLMELADSRVQVSGCSNFQLKRLGEIRHALTKSADSLAETAAKKVIRFCGDILSGKQGIPLGIGDVLRRQMGRVASLAAVIGGLDAMSSTAKSAAIEANEVAGKILEMELGSAASLQDFDIAGK